MSNFFDRFFLVVTVLVAVLTIIDWSIGTQGRERMKQWVGDAWTTLQYETLDGLAISALSPIRRLLNKTYGKGGRWRLVASAFLTNFVFLNLAFLAINLAIEGDIHSASLFFPQYIRLIFNFDLIGLLSQILFVTVLALGWVPFRWLVDTINSDIRPAAALAQWTKSLGWLFVKIMGFSAIFVAFFLLLFAIWSYSITIAFAQIDISDIGGDENAVAELLLSVVFVFSVIGLVAVLPIATFALIFFLLLLLRVLRPWLQPLTLFLLDRLYQSKQGVLTQIAVGLGFAAKFIQEILKYTHWLT